MDSIDTALARDFGVIADMVRLHARRDPDHIALRDDDAALSYGALDALMDRIAAALQRDGLAPGDAIAICATTSVDLCRGLPRRAARRRRGRAARARLDAGQPGRMLHDAGAQPAVHRRVGGRGARRRAGRRPAAHRARRLAPAAAPSTTGWRRPARSPRRSRRSPTGRSTSSIRPAPPASPRASCRRTACAGRMRGAALNYGYGPDTVTLLSTPLYSNTTLVVFFPTLAFGGTVVLMPKFDAGAYLELAERHARHAHHAGAGAVPAADGAAGFRRATTCRRSASSSAPARRSPRRSRPTCWRAGRAGWSSSTA